MAKKNDDLGIILLILFLPIVAIVYLFIGLGKLIVWMADEVEKNNNTNIKNTSKDFIVQNMQSEKERKLQKIIRKHSLFYKKLLEINHKYVFLSVEWKKVFECNWQIFKNFDKTRYIKYLLTTKPQIINELFENVKKNENIYEEYYKEFCACQEYTPEEQIKKIRHRKMSVKRFKELEKEIQSSIMKERPTIDISIVIQLKCQSTEKRVVISQSELENIQEEYKEEQLSAMMVSALAVEGALRMQADDAVQSVLANASGVSFKNVTGEYDTSKLRESYLNDSVLSADTPPTYETRTVMVTLDGAPVIDRAGDSEISNYIASWSGDVAEAEIKAEQKSFLSALSKTGIPYTLERQYDTVINAVAIEVNTKYVSAIKKMSGVDSVVITTAYAEPKTETNTGSGVVTNETDVYETGIYDSTGYASKYGAGQIVPLVFAVPGFCEYICPAGTFEGGVGLLSNSENEGLLAILGPLFTWKFMLLVLIVVASIFIFRAFCRFLCPLGALYGFFCRIAMLGVKIDKNKCTDCGLCIGVCKMDTKRVGDHECIHCGACISVCPAKAISWKGSNLFVRGNDTDAPAIQEIKPLSGMVKPAETPETTTTEVRDD